MFRFLALTTIWLYQHTFSLDHGPLQFLFPNGFCRYYPTCSDYSAQAIRKYGFWRGSWLGFCRILRCHPWAKGGFDPLI